MLLPNTEPHVSGLGKGCLCGMGAHWVARAASIFGCKVAPLIGTLESAQVRKNTKDPTVPFSTYSDHCNLEQQWFGFW